MKVIFLAPGLSRIKRGTERFVLELASQLRGSGLDAVCWGTRTAPGVEAINVPSRIELQDLAAAALKSDPAFSNLLPSALQDWSNYAEDQLFAIPAALRIRKLLEAGEKLLVYGRWQGGFVDPSGAATDLLKTLASATREGKASLLVHTDYIYPPIDSLLWTAGAFFHSLGPWLTESLLQLSISSDAIAELPMCIDASSYRNARARRDAVRAALGIPPEAFVILSVGAFDIPTPDKRHGHTLHEILQLPNAQNVWWVVVGSRGTSAPAWEEEARRALSSRFIPLTNIPFEEMPGMYGAADLFTLASLDETFGLVYLEAQMAGLPVVIHDSRVTRHICARIPEKLGAISVVDMRRKSAAAAAMSQWIAWLTNPAKKESVRATLADFARAQEQRFSWQSISAHYAAAFHKLLEDRVATSTKERYVPGAWEEQVHKQGVRLYQEAKYSEALALIGRSLGARETAERWNDWAAVQTALGEAQEAERGFRRALELEPEHSEASQNLGVLLSGADRFGEAIQLLEAGLVNAEEPQRSTIAQLLDACRAKAAAQGSVSSAEISSYLKKLAANNKSYTSLSLEDITCCETLLDQIPAGSAGQCLLGVGPYAEFLAPAIRRFKKYTTVECPTQRGETSVASSEPAEEAEWPFENSSFDVVVFGQMLAAVPGDPMRVFVEINRVLKSGGVLILTVPNIASAKSLHSLLRGEAPYVDGRFSATAGGSAHHSREYTVSEVEALATAAGFGSVELQTRDIFWEQPPTLAPALASSAYLVGSRGDTIFLRTKKESALRDRFPGKLYDRTNVVRDASAPMRILVVHETLPRMDRGGADHRLMQVITLLREQGHAVTFLTPRSYGKETYAPRLRDMGVEIRMDDAQVLRAEGVDIVPQWTLQEILREGQFDVALVGLWFWMGVSLPEHYLDEIRRHSPRTRIAILTDDCHGLRESGSGTLSGLWSDRERAADFSEREMETYRLADLIVCISEADKRRIGDRVPIEVLPMMVESGPDAPGFAEREGLVYLADFNNPASLDGLEWYLREVAPRVRKELPDVKLYLVGAGLSPDWTTSDPSIVRVGYVSDLAAEFGRRRILVSPVRFGTGIKTKNLHALAHGLPIVTNAKGAEGLAFRPGETALIEEDPAHFAQAVVHLYRDAAFWEKLSANSRVHAAKLFSKDAMDAALRALLDRAPTLQPLSFDPAHAWSMRLVEKIFLETLTYQPAKERLAIRMLAYSRAAEQLIARGKQQEARRQLRHVFNYVPNKVSRGEFFAVYLPIVESMERSYRALGDSHAAAELRREARLFSASAFPEIVATLTEPPAVAARPTSGSPSAQYQSSRQNGKTHGETDLSVIIPTYNRKDVLAECLHALSAQTIAPRRFEVIVVDDGSTDGTAEVCRTDKSRHAFHYIHQQNAGAGAARRLGVAQATGKYLLLMNDDTIAAPDLLARHLAAQREHAREKLAVLGNFCYPDAAKNRALTYFLSSRPFLFPQVTLEQGVYSNYSFFVTCNLSVAREAVLAAGSFDPVFRVAEDTELGIRLSRLGFRVLYVPEARAIHQHLNFTIGDLICRAQTYGATLVGLYQKHPSLLADGKEPFGTLDDASLRKLQESVEQNAAEVADATRSLKQFDSINFLPFFSNQLDGKNAAEQVIDLFSRSVPNVFWHHIFESFLSARNARAPFPVAPHNGSVVEAPLIPQNLTQA